VNDYRFEPKGAFFTIGVCQRNQNSDICRSSNCTFESFLFFGVSSENALVSQNDMLQDAHQTISVVAGPRDVYLDRLNQFIGVTRKSLRNRRKKPEPLKMRDAFGRGDPVDKRQPRIAASPPSVQIFPAKARTARTNWPRNGTDQ
jgi:hypothetical protein